MVTVTIDINLDEKCKRCKKGGATPSGLCLNCIGKAVTAGEFDHILKPAKDGLGKAVIESVASATGAPEEKKSPGPLFENTGN